MGENSDHFLLTPEQKREIANYFQAIQDFTSSCPKPNRIFLPPLVEEQLLKSVEKYEKTNSGSGENQ